MMFLFLGVELWLDQSVVFLFNSVHGDWTASCQPTRSAFCGITVYSACSEVGLGHPLKKSLFPVQRVAKIVASWAAGKSFWGGDKRIIKIMSLKKSANLFFLKFQIGPFIVSHPAGTQETTFF